MALRRTDELTCGDLQEWVTEMFDRFSRALSSYLDNDTFRRDAAMFLSLPPASVDNLIALIENHGTFDVPMSDLGEFENTCGLEGKGRHVLAAAKLIRAAAKNIDDSDRNQELNSFASLMKVTQFSPEKFSRFFSELPNLQRKDLRKAAIAVAPTLSDVRLYSDLRVIPHGPASEWELVPVVVARLGFDENVAGQQALFIQLTEESLAELRREVERAEVALRAIRDRLGEPMLLRKDEIK